MTNNCFAQNKTKDSMKKVGIITYHHYYNYGSALQAYALQDAINSFDGYKAELIDYRAQDDFKRSRLQMLMLRLRRLPTYIKEWKRVHTLQKYGWKLRLKEPAFDKFFDNQFITNGKSFHTWSELKEGSPQYDILVTGSDQTWSPQIGFKPAMFLEFGPTDALRIAYAPSIGVSNLSKQDKDYLNTHLQPFESISCRESVGTNLLRDCVKGKKISNVLDPTFLLTRDDWDRVAIKPKIQGDYILCYFIGHKNYYREIAKQLSEDLNLPLYYIPVSWQELGNDDRLLSETGPLEFLGLIRDARLVLTDSFHGTAFSINYRKTFYSFTKIEGGKSASDNSRLYDILSKFHLEDRLFDKKEHIEFTDIDYSRTNRYIDSERSDSLFFLKGALQDNRICCHNVCTGCMACESVCNHDAIKIEKDTMGFLYPTKDLGKCINCNLCSCWCPNNVTPELCSPIESYVATSKSDFERNSSTSGGLASVIARSIIKNGGIVYGCTSIEASNIRHIRVEKEDELCLLKGSKYVQSNMHGIMPLIKRDLESDKKVLFIGTPCQVAGLKSFLRKPYDSLFTVDFVCHGVPSQQLLNDIVSFDYPEFKTKNLKIDFRFKNNSGNSNYGIKLTNKDGECVYREVYPNERYIGGFLGGLYYRDSCYQCHYARTERVSDITLGDYWDKENNFIEIGKNGLSMLLINTTKGIEIKNCISECIKLKSIDTEILVNRNAQLKHPMLRHSKYYFFKSVYSNDGYGDVLKATLDEEVKSIRISLAKMKIASILKRTLVGKGVISVIKRIR